MTPTRSGEVGGEVSYAATERRWRDRLLRGGLVALAVAAVVALDAGVVPLPLSTPAAVPSWTALHGDGSGTGDRTTAARADEAGGEQARDAAIVAALGTMTSAYAAGDEARFLSVVHPADAALTGRLRTTFRNLRAIGYDDVRFGWPDRRTWRVPLSRPYSDPHAAVPPVVAAVEVRTRITAFDRRAASTLLGLTFAELGGSWVVVGDRDAQNELQLYTASEPWMLGPVYVVRKPHAVVVGETSREADVKRLAASVESAVSTVRSVWKLRSWNGKVVVYATTDRRFVDRQFGGRDARSSRVTKEALFDAKVALPFGNPIFDSSDEPQEASPRMVVTPFLLGRDDAQSRAVLRHELTHVAFAFEGGDGVPTWLVEGTAEYTGFRTGGSSVDGVGALAKRGLPRTTWTQLRRGTWKPALVVDAAEFYTGTSARVGGTYTTSWLTCLYIADEYGEQSLARLYAAAGAMPADEAPGAVEAAILEKVLETDRKTLLKNVTSYSERIRSRFV